MNLLYYFPKWLMSRCLLLLFFQFSPCIQRTSVIFPWFSSPTPHSHWNPSSQHDPTLVSCLLFWTIPSLGMVHWIHLQWSTGSGLKWELNSGPLYEPCLLLTTELSLLHQVKCLKCHRVPCRLVLHIITHRQATYPLWRTSHLSAPMAWVSSTFSCLLLSKSTLIKPEKHLGMSFVFWCFWAGYIPRCSVPSSRLFWNPENTCRWVVSLTTKEVCR